MFDKSISRIEEKKNHTEYKLIWIKLILLFLVNWRAFQL